MFKAGSRKEVGSFRCSALRRVGSSETIVTKHALVFFEITDHTAVGTSQLLDVVFKEVCLRKAPLIDIHYVSDVGPHCRTWQGIWHRLVDVPERFGPWSRHTHTHVHFGVE
eukprot:439081-Amphidinium_carterae.2